MQTEKFLLKMNDASEIAVNRWIPESEEDIKAVIVFSHGMQEHSLRYDRIGSIFAENGFVFNAHDHRGHGKTAQNAEQNGTGMFGKLADKNGFEIATEDLAEVIKEVKNDFPGKKIILLSHSFGSFVAQNYIQKYGSEIDACILSGTSIYKKNYAIGSLITKIAIAVKGPDFKSKFIQNIAFYGYNDRFKNENDEYSWLSANTANREMYRNDAWCGGISTVSFFKDVIYGLHKINIAKNIRKIPVDLPVLAICGSDDPVSGYGKFVNALIKSYKKNGIKTADVKLYMGDRHELFFEENSDTVIQEVIDWIENVIQVSK